MRHLTLLVGLALPLLACTEPEHWSKTDRPAPAEATPEPRERPAADAPAEPRPTPEPAVAPAPEARTEPAVPAPTAGDVTGTPTGTNAPLPEAIQPGQPGVVASAPQPATSGELAAGPRSPGGATSAAPQPIPGEQVTTPPAATGAATQPAPGERVAAQPATGQPTTRQPATGQPATAPTQGAPNGASARQPGAVASGVTQPRAPTPAAVSADPRLTLKGPVTQGGLVVAKVQGQVTKVTFPGHRVNVGDDGTFLLAFARTAPASEKMTITFADGTTLDQMFQVAQRTYQADVIDGLPEDEVRVDARDRKEHAAEDARIHAARMKNTASDCALQGFAWPARGRVTSRYGQPRTINGQEGGIHWGVDLAVPTGTPVAAPACGTVAFVESDVPLSGGTLVIDHGRGVTSTFLHLSGFTKKVGDVVEKGEVVARSGNTGRATGAHLDWRMNFFEVRIDPELLVPAQPGTM